MQAFDWLKCKICIYSKIMQWVNLGKPFNATILALIKNAASCQEKTLSLTKNYDVSRPVILQSLNTTKMRQIGSSSSKIFRKWYLGLPLCAVIHYSIPQSVYYQPSLLVTVIVLLAHENIRCIGCLWQICLDSHGPRRWTASEVANCLYIYII